jgi:hypothetical protein
MCAGLGMLFLICASGGEPFRQLPLSEDGRERREQSFTFDTSFGTTSYPQHRQNHDDPGDGYVRRSFRDALWERRLWLSEFEAEHRS